MRATVRCLALCALLGQLGACGPGQTSSRCGNGDAGTVTPPAGDAGRPNTRPTASARLGVVVIDVQQSFVQYAATPNMSQVLSNIGALFQLTGQQQTPLLITYEHSKSNALPAQLQALVPGHATEYVKTTFAATGLPAFAAAVTQAGLTHVIVAGAETDVCVMQTALGLRKMGLTVLLEQDAVFTSETNTGPALRRMQQAGVLLADAVQVKAYIEQASPLPRAPSAPVTVIEPQAVGVVLLGLDDASIAASSDPYKSAKLARLRELLLISEWFDFPLYGTAATLSLPAQLAGLISKSIQPVAQLTQNSAVEQVVFAGTDANLATELASHGANRDVFLMEDGLLATAVGQAAALEQLYQGGAVPLTYKALYYGMTKSVDLSEWPKDWVDRDPVYYPRTRAPEDLPPIK